MACFHVRKKQHACLRDNAGNVLRFQHSTICAKCGQIFDQVLMDWDFEEGVYVEKV